MKLEFDLITILDCAGFLQGTVLGVLLLVLNKKKYKSTFFLGLFLILYALQRLPIILKGLDAYTYYPELYLLPLNFFWLLFPLFYIYTQQVSVFSSQKIKYWLLYPGIASYVIQIFIFFLPYETKMELLPNLWRSSVFLLGLIYGWIVGIYNLKLISLHSIEVRNYYSMVISKELRWARVFLIAGILGSMLYMIQIYLIPENIYSRIFYLLFDLTIIYWASYHGVTQRNVLSILDKKDHLDIADKSTNTQTNTATISMKNLEKTMSQIDDYMAQSESFSHTELTIIDIARALDIHPKRISVAINTVRNQNFNYYINQLRIKKAEILLKDSGSKHLSVAGIGNEVGFHSKSAFYAAFKKMTGTTPTKFKGNFA